MEVKVVVNAVKMFLQKRIQPGDPLITTQDIGVITPFCAQHEKIEKVLKKTT